MRYQHALQIHERIEVVRGLIETGGFSTPALAEKVGGSIPTVSRIVATLRKLGHDIPVPVPTFKQQLWFDQLYEKLEMAKKIFKQAVEERNALPPSILDRAFAGEL
jgi:hypothetical protein